MGLASTPQPPYYAVVFASLRTNADGEYRALFLLAVAVVKAATVRPFLSAAEADSSSRPNFVIILADDLGYGDVGYNRGRAKTPHLDQMAAEGLTFRAHYVHPMCSPTRAALLSGRYASRFGCTAATNEQVLPFGTETLAGVLQAAGYDTALVGKWHLGSTLAAAPNKFGFSHSYGLLAGGATPDTHEYKTGPFQRTWHRNGEFVNEEGHITDLITREAVTWIGSRGSRPFFLYVPFTAVHVPIAESDPWLKANPHLTDPAARLHAADVTHLDDSVGQILSALERQGVRDRTLVLFLSDNGAHRLENNRQDNYPGAERREVLRVGGTNIPFRGWKTEVYEGGIRTPAIAHWPTRWKPRVADQPLSVTDWMPTLSRLAGAKPAIAPHGDGQDVSSVLDGASPVPSLSSRAIYSASPGYKSRMIRRGEWKLVVKTDNQNSTSHELFNLQSDPAETINLVEREPEKADELTALLDRIASQDLPAIPRAAHK